MRLVIFGLSITSGWGNGHAVPWRSLLAPLAGKGHRIAFYERDVEYYAARRDRQAYPYLELHLYDEWATIREQALREAARADVVMTTSFCPNGAVIQRELLQLRGRRPLQVFYDLDTPVTLAGLSEGRAETLDYLVAEHIPEFDLYLSFSGGPLVEQLRQRWGARQVAPLYLSIDPERYRRVPARKEFRAALSYLGTYAADRQPALDALLTTVARALPEQRFTVAGPLYPPEMVWPDNVARFSHLAPSRHAAFYSSSRMTLNVTREAMRKAGYAPQGRLLEAACCGTPIVTDRWPGLEEFFSPGEEILVAEQSGEVEEWVRASERSEAFRRQLQAMAERARRRVVAQHAGARRAGELEALLLAALSSGQGQAA